MKRTFAKFSLLFLLGLWGCSPSPQYPPAHITDLVSSAYRYSGCTMQERDSIDTADSTAISAVLTVVGDSTFGEWSHSRAVRVFSPDVERVFPDVEPVERALGYTLGRAEALGLDFPRRSYAAVAYGRPESILFVDSVMLIGLNHFLGSDYPGYAGMPEYLKALKTPAQLPYALAEALTGISYPYATFANATLLSHMLYEGALVWAKMQLVSNADAAAALGYTPETYRELVEQETTIWESLVKAQLIFDTSEATIERVCSPAPFVRIADREWPGRVGRFIGWRIVEAFVKNNSDDAALSYLLSEEFYSKDNILQRAGY